ncbi:MAG TPA: pyridoxine 5'-phosphate synthase [Bacteroidales bacterium]|nr:pyridoxine 5'-phosphate synthase [Bacteroidales bacterium]HOU95905.1 pyridoxine 5'-phosphate synthase [Bacteroidales bacterium]HQG35866.1 pyridoxine 5'-phosphate synthase [Bacteroidales bacterium]HQG52376.1 pyridoxine 5'-phosphate synthase [Bacteroidales bacterium]HQJ20125.1 pyridoxine 5'-phosphate synthase [Bacteroidales bacterium]
MTKLSVNINKIATLRNARGGNIPDVRLAAINCQKFGADGITVHPRPDERHIRYSDVFEIKPIITTEFNIEGYPSERFINLVLSVKPDQVTLVPDSPDAITSNAGWDTKKHFSFLKNIVSVFKDASIRISIFVGTDPEDIEYAALAGADRVELYTEPYARIYLSDKQKAVEPYIAASKKAKESGLGINAGHDLNLQNLRYLSEKIPYLDEVSIGHALISDALYLGLENTIQMYKRQLTCSTL